MLKGRHLVVESCYIQGQEETLVDNDPVYTGLVSASQPARMSARFYMYFSLIRVHLIDLKLISPFSPKRSRKLNQPA